jgi:hypothetical protein
LSSFVLGAMGLEERTIDAIVDRERALSAAAQLAPQPMAGPL